MAVTHGFIYTLSDPRTGLVCYVGQTSKCPEDRYRVHIRAAYDELATRRSFGDFWLPVTVRPQIWMALLLLGNVRPEMQVVGLTIGSDDGLGRSPVYEHLEAGEAAVYTKLRDEGCPLANVDVPRLSPYRAA